MDSGVYLISFKLFWKEFLWLIPFFKVFLFFLFFCVGVWILHHTGESFFHHLVSESYYSQTARGNLYEFSSLFNLILCFCLFHLKKILDNFIHINFENWRSLCLTEINKPKYTEAKIFRSGDVMEVFLLFKTAQRSDKPPKMLNGSVCPLWSLPFYCYYYFFVQLLFYFI